MSPATPWQVLASAISPSINHTLTVGSLGGGRCAWQTRGTAGTPRPAGRTGPAAGLLQRTKAQLPAPLHRLGWHTGQSAAGPSPAGPAWRRHPCSMQRASCQISCCPDTRTHCMAGCKAAALPGAALRAHTCTQPLATAFHSRRTVGSLAGVHTAQRMCNTWSRRRPPGQSARGGGLRQRRTAWTQPCRSARWRTGPAACPTSCVTNSVAFSVNMHM